MNWQISFIIHNDFNQTKLWFVSYDFKIMTVKYVSRDNDKSFQVYIPDSYWLFVWAERDSIQYLSWHICLNTFVTIYFQPVYFDHNQKSGTLYSLDHGLLKVWTELLSIFLADLPTWGGKLGPKLHPGGGFFGPWFFII